MTDNDAQLKARADLADQIAAKQAELDALGGLPPSDPAEDQSAHEASRSKPVMTEEQHAAACERLEKRIAEQQAELAWLRSEYSFDGGEA